jgi:hypothetical protein
MECLVEHRTWWIMFPASETIQSYRGFRRRIQGVSMWFFPMANMTCAESQLYPTYDAACQALIDHLQSKIDRVQSRIDTYRQTMTGNAMKETG